MLSFKHEVFFEVAQQLSFTKASEVLCISQPAISNHIKQLESEFKANLFERKGNSILLTASGKILLEAVTKAKTIEKQLAYDMSTLHDVLNAKGELKLGASTTVALYIVPPVLSSFLKKHRQVKVGLVNRNSENVLKALLEHEIDLGIVEGKKKNSLIKSQYFLSDEVVPVCSSSSPLAKHPRYSLQDLKKLEVALRERGSGTLTALLQTLKKLGIKQSDLNVNIRLGGTEALKNFILADTCVGFLPMRSVAKELAAGILVQLHIDGLSITRHFYFIQRMGENMRGIDDAFIKFAKRHYKISL